MWTNDYSSTPRSRPFHLFMKFVDDIPHLRSCYDIKYTQDGAFMDPRDFEITIDLYFYKDGNNPYSDAASQPSFVPFSDNNSIMTWTTNHSDMESISHTSEFETDGTKNATNPPLGTIHEIDNDGIVDEAVVAMG